MENLICKEISILLPLYLESKTTEDESTEIEEHLTSCSKCFEKFLSLKNISELVKSSVSREECLNGYEFFRSNICSYLDNELDECDYYAFAAYVSKSQEAREELLQMFRFDEHLKKSIRENSKILQTDLSKPITDEIKSESTDYIHKQFFKIAALITLFLVLTVIVGFFSISEDISSLTHLGMSAN